jgi:hypothetical protein
LKSGKKTADIPKMEPISPLTALLPNPALQKFDWHFVNFCVQLGPAKFDSQATEGRYRQPASPPH